MADPSLANINNTVLDHKYLPNVCLLMNSGQMDPMWVLFVTIDLGKKHENNSKSNFGWSQIMMYSHSSIGLENYSPQL